MQTNETTMYKYNGRKPVADENLVLIVIWAIPKKYLTSSTGWNQMGQNIRKLDGRQPLL